MRLQSHVSLLELALKRHRTSAARTTLSRNKLLSLQCARHASTAPGSYPKDIAVLGAGIAGLSSAFFMSREFPKSNITIYEQKKETGGWIRSRTMEKDGAHVLFEYGARTLRPGWRAYATAGLIQELDLENEVLRTDKSLPVAKNRYIYYPDRLNKLPSSQEDLTFLSIARLWTSGILDGVWKLALEITQPQRYLKRVKDESVGDFVSRRVDKRVADNLVSAVMHGIYAGDIYQLSAKTLLEKFWYLEGKWGSAAAGLLIAREKNIGNEHPWDAELHTALEGYLEDIQLSPWMQRVMGLAGPGTSTFTLKNGLQTLTNRLEMVLTMNPQVKILKETHVTDIRKIENSQQIEIETDTKDLSPAPFDFVVSTIPSPTLTPSVTVRTVNLFYKQPNLVPVTGFGYLIPRSISLEQNPERALGVIFDHDGITGAETLTAPADGSGDSAPAYDVQPAATHTNLTVMLGGHWWDGWLEFPSEEEASELAQAVVRRHLGITAAPDEVRSNLHENCIPQYTVGYEGRVKRYGEELAKQYDGRLRVIGNQVGGVGVNDVVRGAWALSRDMANGGWKKKSVGPAFDRLADERDWV